MSHDERIREALRALPRHRPGPAFHGRVLAGLRRPPPRRWLVVAVPAAALLVAVLATGALVRRQELQRSDLELLRELAALRAEQSQLRGVLRDLGGRPSALLLDADDGRDLILDLRPAPTAIPTRHTPDRPHPGARP